MTDVIELILAQWNPSNTDDITPNILYEVPQGTKSSHNYNQSIFLKDMEDDLNELGLERTHQDSKSRDVFECDIFAKTKSRAKKFRDELRRIARIDITCYGDDEYALLDWQGGRWMPEAKRWHWNMSLMAYRSGYVFS